MSPSSSLSLDLPSRDGLGVGQLPLPSPGLSSGAKNTNPIASKVTAVLSTSYSDTEFRNALALLDERGVANDARTRRQIRLNLQKEVIDSNGEIISEFGRVSEVSCLVRPLCREDNFVDSGYLAIEAHWIYPGQAQFRISRDEEPISYCS